MLVLFVYLFIYLYDLLYRIRPGGDPPSPRAAHAASAVGTMVVFQVSDWWMEGICQFL